jgi:hypothetical protein
VEGEIMSCGNIEYIRTIDRENAAIDSVMECDLCDWEILVDNGQEVWVKRSKYRGEIMNNKPQIRVNTEVGGLLLEFIDNSTIHVSNTTPLTYENTQYKLGCWLNINSVGVIEFLRPVGGFTDIIPETDIKHVDNSRISNEKRAIFSNLVIDTVKSVIRDNPDILRQAEIAEVEYQIHRLNAEIAELNDSLETAEKQRERLQDILNQLVN